MIINLTQYHASAEQLAEGAVDLSEGRRALLAQSLTVDALRDQGIEPVYAFSVRESIEQTQPDGSVRKVNVFRHAGFVDAAPQGEEVK